MWTGLIGPFGTTDAGDRKSMQSLLNQNGQLCVAGPMPRRTLRVTHAAVCPFNCHHKNSASTCAALAADR